MLRFFRRPTVASKTPAPKTTRSVSLSVESLEGRATPSGIGQALKQISQAVAHVSQSPAMLSKFPQIQVSHMTLTQALTSFKPH